jgi:hypothetical protein
MQRHKKIVVFIPKAGFRASYETKFVESFLGAKDYLLAKAEEIPFSFTISQYFSHTFPIDANRNECMSMAINNNIDLAIFLDTDHIVQHDSLFKFVKHDLPVVAGVYYAKTDPHPPIVYKEHEESVDFDLFNAIYKIGDKTIYEYEDLFEADMVGAGCFAMSLDVMKKLEKPYFKYRPLPESLITPDEKKAYSGNVDVENELEVVLRNWTADVKFKIDNEIHTATEDVWFWRNVKKAGYKLLVDPTITFPHGPMDIWADEQLSKAYYEGKVKNSPKLKNCTIPDPKVPDPKDKKKSKVPTNGEHAEA